MTDTIKKIEGDLDVLEMQYISHIEETLDEELPDEEETIFIMNDARKRVKAALTVLQKIASGDDWVKCRKDPPVGFSSNELVLDCRVDGLYFKLTDQAKHIEMLLERELKND